MQTVPGLASAQKPATALEVLHSRFQNMHSHFVELCGRLDSGVARLMPIPRNAEEAGKTPPPPQGHMNQLGTDVNDFELTLKWLEEIADRLDIIA